MAGFFANLSHAFTPTEHPEAGERFTLQELRRLHSVLTENTTVNEGNRELVVETLRSLAELVIWGDQHDARFFDFFAEKHLLSHFNRILRQPANQRGEVPQQVLQTLSILIANIRSQTNIFYLFSNNYINELITTPFDFDDDEIIGYYINLLKAISLKFTKTTVQFFFELADGGSPDKFPLYSESIKFIRNKDGMVRSAVRALTLNVYSIEDEKVQNFVCSKPHSAYFQELAISIVDQCQILDAQLSSIQEGRTVAEHPVEAALAEIEDLLSYCNDILANGVTQLAKIMLEALWAKFVGPVLLWPLLTKHKAVPAWAAGKGGKLHRQTSATSAGSFSGVQHPSSPSQRNGTAATLLPSGDVGVVGCTAALMVLERLVMVVTESAFLRPVLIALLAGSKVYAPIAQQSALPSWASAGALLRAQESQSQSFGRQIADAAEGVEEGDDDDEDTMQAEADAGQFVLPKHARRVLQLHPTQYRDAFLSILRGGDAIAATAAVRVLLALLLCRSVDNALLDAAGLLPSKRRKQRDLLDSLTAPALQQQQQQPNGHMPRHASTPSQDLIDSAEASHFDSSRSLRSASERVEALDPDRQLLPPPPQHRQPAAQPSSHLSGDIAAQLLQRRGLSSHSSGGRAAQRYVEVQSALCGLLALRTMPVAGLWTTAWLVLQLVPRAEQRSPPDPGSGSPGDAAAWGSHLSSHQRGVLSQAWTAARDHLMEQMGGMWCDALPLLIQMEWTKVRMGLKSPGNQSTTAAVNAWSQAHQASQLVEQGLDAPAPAASQRPISDSAASARLLWQAALHFITLSQLRQAVVSSNGEASPTTGLPIVEEASQRAVEIKTRDDVVLTSRVSCSVAFNPGEERQVFFAMEGRPQGGEGMELAAAVVRSVPVVLLADQGSRVNSGKVLSVAPLMGANPLIDPAHKRWLHIHVRPPVRGLLKVLRASSVASTHANLARQLVDGHWVLSFPDGDAAHSARDLVDQHQAKLRASYCDALAALLLPEES